MTQTLALHDPAYLQAQAVVATVHDDLVTQHERLSRVVAALLDGGWSGVAAGQYADAWSDWEAGCAQVLAGLAQLRGAMASVFHRLHEADAVRADALTDVGARLAATVRP